MAPGIYPPGRAGQKQEYCFVWLQNAAGGLFVAWVIMKGPCAIARSRHFAPPAQQANGGVSLFGYPFRHLHLRYFPGSLPLIRRLDACKRATIRICGPLLNAALIKLLLLITTRTGISAWKQFL